MPNYTFLPYEQLPELHTLPDPFQKPDGTRISSPDEWEQQRSYLKAMLAHYLYGEMPPAPGNVTGTVINQRMLDSSTISEQVSLTFGPENSLRLDITCIRPNDGAAHPVLIWNDFGPRDQCLAEDTLTKSGVVLIRFNKEQLGVDSYAFYSQSPCLQAYPGYSWRAIAVWAWGYSRIIDYLENCPYADMKKIAVTGYSRNGKVALCAAIYDERISLCAPGGSGCGGSGNFRFMGDRLGEGGGVQETIGSMSRMFGYWWADELQQFGTSRDKQPLELAKVLAANSLDAYYKALLEQIDPSDNGKIGPEFRLPFDMHFARGLIAPRLLLTTDSLDDDWANPYGIQVSWRASAEVYRLLGVPQNNAMFFREGSHAFSHTDWEAIAEYLLLHFSPEKLPQPKFHYIALPAPGTPKPADPNLPDWLKKKPHFSWNAPGMEH